MTEEGLDREALGWFWVFGGGEESGTRVNYVKIPERRISNNYDGTSSRAPVRLKSLLFDCLRNYDVNVYGKEFVIDMTEVEEMDTSGVAVFVEAFKLGKKRGVDLKFKGLSEKVIDIIRICRAESLFGLGN